MDEDNEFAYMKEDTKKVDEILNAYNDGLLTQYEFWVRMLELSSNRLAEVSKQ